jgi:hypothetical protein
MLDVRLWSCTGSTEVEVRGLRPLDAHSRESLRMLFFG